MNLSPQGQGHLAMLAFSALVAGSFSLGTLAAPLIDPAALTVPRFALAGKVKLKAARGKVPKGAKGSIVGYWGLDRYQVKFGDETMTVDGKYLTPCSVERAKKQRGDDV